MYSWWFLSLLILLASCCKISEARSPSNSVKNEPRLWLGQTNESKLPWPFCSHIRKLEGTYKMMLLWWIVTCGHAAPGLGMAERVHTAAKRQELQLHNKMVTSGWALIWERHFHCKMPKPSDAKWLQAELPLNTVHCRTVVKKGAKCQF